MLLLENSLAGWHKESVSGTVVEGNVDFGTRTCICLHQGKTFFYAVVSIFTIGRHRFRFKCILAVMTLAVALLLRFLILPNTVKNCLAGDR